MRMPSDTTAGSNTSPFSTTECTEFVIASIKVEAPGVFEVKRTLVVEPKYSAPWVRSISTW